MALPAGSWILGQIHPVLTLQAEVKGRPFTLKAPIDSADVVIAEDLTLSLGVRIDQVSAGNFLLDAALRGFLVSYGAHQLFFAGTGELAADPVELTGVARAGQVAVDLVLDLRELASTEQSLVLGVTGTAVFKDVDVPIPGVGSLDQLELAVLTQLDLVVGQ
ncbi:MAG: hypothetical protein Q8M73_00575 [Actinomycetota bacterium]|nr:hypothetical protein [Actinomycetota bacterium]